MPAAIGMALKLARIATGRFKFVSMWDSFHGASLDAISIGGEAVYQGTPGLRVVPAEAWLDKLAQICPSGEAKTAIQYLGDDTAVVDPSVWKAVGKFLREDPALDFDMQFTNYRS